jgi:hypothetical protein
VRELGLLGVLNVAIPAQAAVFANLCAPAKSRPVTLSELVSAVLNCAALFGIVIITETEVYDLATDTVAQMEAELTELQPAGGLPALNGFFRRRRTGIRTWECRVCLAKIALSRCQPAHRSSACESQAAVRNRPHVVFLLRKNLISALSR